MAERKENPMTATLRSLDERVSPGTAEALRTVAKRHAPTPVEPPARTVMPIEMEAAGVSPRRQALTRIGKKNLLVPVEPALHKLLKHMAVEEETSIEAIVRGAIDDMLKRKDAIMPLP